MDDLRDLCAFNQNISVCLGKSIQHMTDSLFITMSNFTLMRRDAYFDHLLKPGVKQDYWCSLKNPPLQSYGLFPDDALCNAEEDINKFESNRRTSQPRSGPWAFPQKKPNRSIHTHQWHQALGNRRVPSPMLLLVTNRHGDLLAIVQIHLDHQEAEGGVASAAQSPPVVLISLNDNYCLSVHTAPNSVKELSLGVVPNQDFVPTAQNINFVSNNLRPPQKKGKE